jgi:hypothetical protein
MSSIIESDRSNELPELMQPPIAAMAITDKGKNTLFIRSPRFLSSFHRKGFCIDRKSTALEEY